MRIFCSIVQPFVLSMFHSRQDFTLGSPITLQFIGDDHPRHIAQFFEELAKESFRCLCVASALHEDIEYVAILIYCSPEVMLFASNGEDYLVQMPDIAAARATTAQFVGVRLPECEAPLPHCFMGHDNPALRQEVLNIAKTE
jgi:hypothetical protein